MISIAKLTEQRDRLLAKDPAHDKECPRTLTPYSHCSCEFPQRIISRSTIKREAAQTLTSIIDALSAEGGVEEMLHRQVRETSALDKNEVVLPGEMEELDARHFFEVLDLARGLTLQLADANQQIASERATLNNVRVCAEAAESRAEQARLAEAHADGHRKVAIEALERETLRAEQATALLGETLYHLKELHPNMDEKEPCNVFDIWQRGSAFLAKPGEAG